MCYCKCLLALGVHRSTLLEDVSYIIKRYTTIIDVFNTYSWRCAGCMKRKVDAKEHPVYGRGRYLMNIYFFK